MRADIQSIINDLYKRNVVTNKIMKVDKMSGTTEGLVYLLRDDQNSYVLKLDQYEAVRLVNHFFDIYHGIVLLPQLLYSDTENAYYVYSYIHGTTHYNRGTKKSWLTRLVTELFNHYVIYNQDEFWGRFDIPRESWHEFNVTSINEARRSVADILSDNDYHQVLMLVDKLFGHDRPVERYLLHGDTGVHNFVFYENSIVGVIDPSPMVGPILYDFIYAFCSSPDDLDLETLLEGYKLLSNNKLDPNSLISEVIVHLYCRIGICSKYHPHDLPEYLIAWDYWKALCK